ncbi:MAG: hypothetical protein K2K73_01815 [Ureaplasma sp.]|nr:hypothetical protein [Ureaplasma sp.]
MVICGNIFSKINKRVIIKMINEKNELDFSEFDDPDDCIKNYKYEDFVIIKLDDTNFKISEAYILDNKN